MVNIKSISLLPYQLLPTQIFLIANSLVFSNDIFYMLLEECLFQKGLNLNATTDLLHLIFSLRLIFLSQSHLV